MQLLLEHPLLTSRRTTKQPLAPPAPSHPQVPKGHLQLPKKEGLSRSGPCTHCCCRLPNGGETQRRPHTSAIVCISSTLHLLPSLPKAPRTPNPYQFSPPLTVSNFCLSQKNKPKTPPLLHLFPHPLAFASFYFPDPCFVWTNPPFAVPQRPSPGLCALQGWSGQHSPLRGCLEICGEGTIAVLCPPLRSRLSPTEEAVQAHILPQVPNRALMEAGLKQTHQPWHSHTIFPWTSIFVQVFYVQGLHTPLHYFFCT